MTTGSMTVDTLGEWLTVQSVCNHIHVAENNQAATSDWTIQAPNVGSPILRVPAGQARDIRTSARFLPGEKIALLTAITGSMTFTWMEEL